MNTNPLLNLSASQLKKAADLKERIDALNAELGAVLGGETPVPFVTTPTARRGRPPGKQGGMSAAGRAKIAAAARARWAKVRAAKGGAASAVTETPAKKKRTMSAAARKKIAAAQKARWAKVKAGK